MLKKIEVIFMANIAVYTRLARKEGSDDITVAYLRLSKKKKPM